MKGDGMSAKGIYKNGFSAKLIVIVILGCLLQACGQKGALFLPALSSPPSIEEAVEYKTEKEIELEKEIDEKRDSLKKTSEY
jgi:predicted small lipoprotein YifL